MKPYTVLLTNTYESVHRIDARCRGRRNGRDNADPNISTIDIYVDRLCKFFRHHFEPPIAFDLSQRSLAETKSDAGFIDRGMDVLGAVNTKYRQVRAAAHAFVSNIKIRPLACGGNRVHRRNRSRVI